MDIKVCSLVWRFGLRLLGRLSVQGYPLITVITGYGLIADNKVFFILFIHTIIFL